MKVFDRIWKVARERILETEEDLKKWMLENSDIITPQILFVKYCPHCDEWLHEHLLLVGEMDDIRKTFGITIHESFSIPRICDCGQPMLPIAYSHYCSAWVVMRILEKPRDQELSDARRYYKAHGTFAHHPEKREMLMTLCYSTIDHSMSRLTQIERTKNKVSGFGECLAGEDGKGYGFDSGIMVVSLPQMPKALRKAVEKIVKERKKNVSPIDRKGNGHE